MTDQEHKRKKHPRDPNQLAKSIVDIDAHAHATVHKADECVLKEGGKPHACGRVALHVL
jgi:hypothetical protein